MFAGTRTFKARAGFIGRAGARLLDSWLVGFGVFFAWMIGFMSVAGDCAREHPDCKSGLYVTVVQSIGMTVFFLGTVLPVIYDTVCVARWGKTAGKSAAGIGVVRLDGERPRLWQCLVRAVVYWLSLPLPAIIIWAVLVTPADKVWAYAILAAGLLLLAAKAAVQLSRRRLLHDWLARTDVILLN